MRFLFRASFVVTILLLLYALANGIAYVRNPDEYAQSIGNPYQVTMYMMLCCGGGFAYITLLLHARLLRNKEKRKNDLS